MFCVTAVAGQLEYNSFSKFAEKKNVKKNF